LTVIYVARSYKVFCIKVFEAESHVLSSEQPADSARIL
jgi:hypothetical protein